MDDTDNAGISDKLLIFLNNITQGTTNGVDESYLENLLTSISKESEKVSSTKVLSWFESNISEWGHISAEISNASFLIRLCGIFLKEEQNFLDFDKSGVVGKLLAPSQVTHKFSAVRCSYLSALCDVVSHESGRKWLRTERTWKHAVQMAVLDSSMYVRRQASNFLRSILTAEKDNIMLNMEIVEEILNPILSCLKEETAGTREEEVERTVTPRLKLISSLLEDCLDSEEANALPELLITKVKLDVLLRKWTDSCSKESFLDTLVTSYGMLILAVPSQGKPSDVSGIMDLYRVLLKSKRICAFLTLSRFCHMTWVRTRGRRHESDNHIEIHFFIMQLMPVVVCRRKLETSSLMDQYINKWVEKASEETFRMAYSLKEIMREVKPEVLIQKATRAILGLIDYHKLLGRDNVVLTFQTLAWVLKNFVPVTCERDLNYDEAEVANSRELCVTAAPLLNAVLHAFCVLLDAYRIKWDEAFEGLALLKLCHWLLANSELPTKTVVQALKLTKLTISQCMPPSLVLLVDRIEGTSLEAVGPLLLRKLHDTQWEVRDSALEVFIVIAELALVKHPVFQELLLSLQCGYLAVSMLQGDCESYVRASAIRLLSAMIPLDKMWSESLAALQLGTVIQTVIRNDTEGIVRREAALLICSLLRSRYTLGLLEELLPTMLSVTLHDLHWEVRVNALDFWNEVIHLELQQQGMMDGVFPEVTFSRDSKKIVTLTLPEIQTRLRRVLERLSRIGCLNVLSSALQDDVDLEVAQKAREVVAGLVGVLGHYEVLVDEKESGHRSKRQKACATDEGGPIPAASSPQVNSKSSDDVIEGIVNSSDMNLLAGVLADDSDAVTVPETQAVKMVTPETFLSHIRDVSLPELTCIYRPNAPSELSTLLTSFLSLDIQCDLENAPDCY